MLASDWAWLRLHFCRTEEILEMRDIDRLRIGTVLPAKKVKGPQRAKSRNDASNLQ